MQARGPGRPRKVSRAAIAAAGRELTLAEATVATVAAHLGVGVRTLYKHTEGIVDIQAITAEAIMADWTPPAAEGGSLAEHLLEVALSLRALAQDNPGIAGFLLHASLAVSPAVVARIDTHHGIVEDAYALPPGTASILLATVAEHALAVTDAGMRHPHLPSRDPNELTGRDDLPRLAASAGDRDPEAHFRFAARALIRGMLADPELALPAP